MDSPLIPTPTPRTTTTCPTVILRTDPLTPGRRKRNFKITAVEMESKDSTVRETHKHLKPLPPTTHRRAHRRSRQLRFRTVMGIPVFPCVFAALANSDHSAGDDLLRMGRVAIIRDIGAATCVYHLIVTISSRTYRGLQFRGSAIFPVHGRDHLFPISLGPLSRKLYRSKDWGLDHKKSTIPIREVDLPTCGQGNCPHYRLSSSLIDPSMISLYSRSKPRPTSVRI